MLRCSPTVSCLHTARFSSASSSDRLTNFDPQVLRFDANQAADVYLWTEKRRNPELESRGANGLGLIGPSGNAATSARGNYMLFDHAGQVWLRYLGPR